MLYSFWCKNICSSSQQQKCGKFMHCFLTVRVMRSGQRILTKGDITGGGRGQIFHRQPCSVTPASWEHYSWSKQSLPILGIIQFTEKHCASVVHCLQQKTSITESCVIAAASCNTPDWSVSHDIVPPSKICTPEIQLFIRML